MEVTIPVKGTLIRAEQVSSDMYVSIELVEEVIERQLKKYRNKLITKHQSAAEAFNDEFMTKDLDDDEDIRIVRTKRFGIKPMYPEDACVEMELLGHDFSCSATRRRMRSMWFTRERGNTYGLIEPGVLGLGFLPFVNGLCEAPMGFSP